MHENLDELDDIDANKYVISNDTPEHQAELHDALEEEYGTSIDFISDPDLELVDHMDMKNGDTAYRGYALMDEEGTVIFNTINDHWGEEFDKTIKEIKDEYKNIQ